MIEALKDDRLINELGGRFKFTSLIQHRVRELMDGARPLVERDGRSDIEVAVAEIVEHKITFRLTQPELLPASVRETLTKAGESIESSHAEASYGADGEHDVII